ncbi:PQQ-dependent catabolism-associated CXXCW motif protein [Sedimentitalea nanhaiensis]|uniref:PQQ-dependent catabolism-associated CXXCW motif protein n=1 Tax=Sedimentitalea nanhaiensis TaxID=999627 RepID=A0A1I7E723_9RHOB|nr:PQQ-dependent catabolism-associated CXXCW motif protein [Sedimentitalea nanhaiensis]SFU19722.1 PQQ-dependent catabolism-associated CXXCW motif protein [Sedimentitalea nanhaiensis]
MKQALAVIVIAILPLVLTAQTVSEPDAYRMDHYRAPVPQTLAGATVVGPEQAYILWQSGEVGFVDVLPQAPKPPNLPKGTIWRDKPRDSIPRAIWLPNVGYGAIADVTAQYFRDGLDRITGGDTDHPVLFFCLEDCWMSWNAAKRAIEWGYAQVYWLPEGTDGWALWDYPLQRVEPEEPQPQ